MGRVVEEADGWQCGQGQRLPMKPVQFLPIDLAEVTAGPSLHDGRPDPQALASFRRRLTHPHLDDFFALYMQRYEELGRIPQKGEFGPQVLRAHLGYVGIVAAENDAEPLDVVIRLAGTRLVDFIGAELKGMSVSRLFRRPPEFVEKLWSPLFREARPRLDAGNLSPLEKPYVDYVALHVPLAAPDGRICYAAFRAIFSLDGGKTWS